jgi:glycosyltransferase involved in cell wall biosynthesis
MRILRILPTIDPSFGGPMNGAKNFDRLFKEKGITVDVLTLDAPDEPFIKEYGGNVIALGPSLFFYRLNFKLIKWLFKNAGSYDCVIINGVWQFHSFCSALVLRLLGKKYFLFTHGMLDPWFKETYKAKHIKKLIYWVLFERLSVNGARAVLFTSEEEKLLARESFPLYKPQEKVVRYGTFIPLDVDVVKGRASFENKFPALAGRKIILFLGRIHEKKGIEELLEAFEQLHRKSSEFLLVIAGPEDSDYSATIKLRSTDSTASSSIFWVGPLYGDMKWGALSLADVFCLPSHQENFGISVAEALASGTPVIISNKVNIWREISSAKAGLVCEDNVDSLASTLLSWESLSEEEKNVFRENSIGCYQQYFNLHNAVDSLAEVLKE